MKDQQFTPLSAELVHHQYDNLFKSIIGGGWNVSSDGDVESPWGFFALVETPKHAGERAEMIDALELDEELTAQLNELGTTLTSGWFVTIENSDGLIWVYQMPSELSAKHVFSDRADHYHSWREAAEGDE